MVYVITVFTLFLFLKTVLCVRERRKIRREFRERERESWTFKEKEREWRKKGSTASGLKIHPLPSYNPPPTPLLQCSDIIDCTTRNPDKPNSIKPYKYRFKLILKFL